MVPALPLTLLQGLTALRRLLLTAPASLPPPYKLLLLTRPSTSHTGVDSLSALLASHPHSSLAELPLDLADLRAMRAAAPGLTEQVKTLQHGTQRTVVFLNAAIWPDAKHMSADEADAADALHVEGSVEQSCAVNYLCAWLCPRARGPPDLTTPQHT